MVIANQKQNIKRRFSKIRNAIWESDTTTIQELQDLKDSKDKNKPIKDQKKFSESKSTTPSSKKIITPESSTTLSLESTNRTHRKLHIKCNKTQKKLIHYDKNFKDDYILPVVIHPQTNPARGQVQFCHNLIANLFEKGNCLCKQQFPEMKIKRQMFDHYLLGISNTTSY